MLTIKLENEQTKKKQRSKVRFHGKSAGKFVRNFNKNAKKKKTRKPACE